MLASGEGGLYRKVVISGQGTGENVLRASGFVKNGIRDQGIGDREIENRPSSIGNDLFEVRRLAAGKLFSHRTIDLIHFFA